MFKGGALYLFATIEGEDKPMNESPTGWLGIDLRVVNPAVTADGETLPRPGPGPAPKANPTTLTGRGPAGTSTPSATRTSSSQANSNRKERTLPNDCSTSEPGKKPVSPTT